MFEAPRSLRFPILRQQVRLRSPLFQFERRLKDVADLNRVTPEA